MFSDRIRRRMREWWGPQEGLGRTLHRRKEQVVRRRWTDDESKWRCCARWQRTLANKWNAREFARRHGCLVPELYWYGRGVWRIPFGRLPPHYVVRSVYGTSTKGTYAMAEGIELFSGKATSSADLRAHLIATRGFVSRVPLLIEEFLRGEDGEYRLPVDYKCHMFGDVVGVIERVERLGRKTEDVRLSYYTADWEPMPHPIRTDRWGRSDPVPPPRCLGEIVAAARRLGVAYGTFVRVDLYATDRGCVFGEFTPTPTAGNGYTAFADEYLGALWRSAFPAEPR
jgi:hypothetical protein